MVRFPPATDLSEIKGEGYSEETDSLTEIAAEISHTSRIFPEATNLTITFESPDGSANTWGNWTEIVDSGANTLSDIFATEEGHLEDVFIETQTQNSNIYMLEVAINVPQVVILSKRFASPANPVHDAAQPAIAVSEEVEAGDTLYYRLMCSAAGGDCTVHIRYFLYD